jgi:hypothetical protein
VLEGHRERKAAEAAQQAELEWRGRHDAYVSLIDQARTFRGAQAEGILLAPGESVYLQVTDCSLVEERRGPGTYVGHSQGVSIPVASIGGRSIRYRVGASKGHFVQGEPLPTVIDTGTVTVTSSRVVFQGAAQTRECPFDKLLGVQHDAAAGTTTVSLSNRKTPMTVRYGPSVSETFEFRLDLALAVHRGTVDDLVAGLRADLAAIDASRPEPPEPAPAPPAADTDQQVPTPPSATAGGSSEGVAPVTATVPPSAPVESAPPPPSPPASTPAAPPPPAASPPHQAGPTVVPGWYPDPWAMAPLRWWDGSGWSWQTTGPGMPPVS